LEQCSPRGRRKLPFRLLALALSLGRGTGALQSGQLQPAPTRDSELAGIVVGALLIICSLEFVGAFEQEGWKLAGVLTPIAYVAWSLWLIVVGVALFL